MTRTLVLPNVGATVMNSAVEPSWATTSMGALTAWRSLNARASVEGTATGVKTVRFWDGVQNSIVAAGTAIGVATAQPPLKTTNRLLEVVPTTASYGAYVEDLVGSSRLTITCSASPFAATPNWLGGTVTVAGRNDVASPLASAFDGNRFVVAGEFGGQVLVYAVPQQTACNALPVPTLVATIPNAKEPGLTIDSRGTIWVATIDAVGSVLLAHF